ncbi:MAG: helix-turn-helix domain-containing protein [Christensenellales bacterium]|jgi:two-component system response regulator YesN
MQQKVSSSTMMADACIMSILYDDKKGSRESINYKKVSAYIDENVFRQEFCLQNVADAFGITSSSFSRMFKRIYGQTFLSYVSQKRISKAKHYLVYSNKKLSDIVLMIGYIDASSFIQKFKRSEGITPNKYRQLWSALRK